MNSLICRTRITSSLRPISRSSAVRTFATATESSASSSSSSSSTIPLSTPQPTSSEALSMSSQSPSPSTHFKITLRRSAISLGDKKKGTLKALGLHRRFQTVYYPFGPEVAGKILALKELLEVENVPTHMVMTSQQQREARKAPRGYKVVGSRMDTILKA